MKKVTILALIFILVAGLFVSCNDDSGSTYVKITFNPNGGTGSMEPQFIVTGESTKLTSNSFSNAWKVFDGWATSPDGSKVYEDCQMVALASDVSLYALWKDQSSIVLTNNTEILVAGQIYEVRDDVTLDRSLEITGTGSVMIVLGENKTLTIAGGLPIDEDQELIFDGKGSAVVNEGISGNGKLTIKSGKISATGVTDAFGMSVGTLVIGKDWSLAGDNASGDTLCIGPVAEDTVYEGERFRYMRTVAPVTVTFMANSEMATGEMEPQALPYGFPMNLNKNEFDNTYFTFVEWNTREDGKGQIYSDEEAVNLTGDLTLYAIWIGDVGVITPETTVLKGGNHYRTISGSKVTTVEQRITIEGTETVTLTVSRGTTLNTYGITVEEGQEIFINVDEGAMLLANGGMIKEASYSGIGGSGKGSTGNININGPGTVIAMGGKGAAGIGGAAYDSGGNIVIYGANVDAIGGEGGAGIGGGRGNNGVSLTVDGGSVEALGGEGGAGIGGGENGGSGYVSIKDGRVHAVGGSASAHGIGRGSGTASESSINLNTDILLLVSSDDKNWEEYDTARTQYMNAAKSRILNEDTTELECGYVYMLNSRYSQDNIIIPTRLPVIGTGEVVLFLSRETTLTAKKGISVTNGNKLTIQGTGTLVSGTEMGDQNNNPGIGGDKAVITICSGTVTASGGPSGAGIGGTNSTVTVMRGTVKATGGYKGQGIGGTGSTTTIYDGTVTATGGAEAVGIGGPTTIVTIKTGKITVNGGEKCSAIGGSNCTITINDGTINATAGDGGSGIGGYNCNVTIDKGTIKAYGKGGGSGIGGGTGCDSGTIKINGGDIVACGGAYGIDAIGRGSGSIAPRNTTIAKDLKFVASDDNSHWFPFSSVPRRYMKTGSEGPLFSYIDSNTTTLYPGYTYTINGNVTNDNRLWIDGTSDVDVMIYLPAGKQLTLLCGIDVVEGQNLCIDGDPSGVLKAMACPETSSKDYYRVAIGSPLIPDGEGSYEYLKCGNIRINGGCIYAYGGEENGDREYGTTAIGGRDCAIFINGGEVNAYGYGDGAAIGGPGRTDKSTYYNVKVIYITGGTVNAYGCPTRGTDGGAGIGTGYKGKYIDEVLITGGTVNAVGGGEDGSGIGGADGFEAGTVTIQGGYVTTSVVGKKIYGIGPREITLSIGRDGSPMKLFGVLYEKSDFEFLFEGRGWHYDYDKKKVYTQMRVSP